MTIEELTAEMIEECRRLLEDHGEIDSAMLFENPRIIDGVAEHFPCWHGAGDCTPNDVEGDLAALNVLIEYCCEMADRPSFEDAYGEL